MDDVKNRPKNFIRQIIDKDILSGKCNKIHTRFPPEPNGYLHIGHAKSICLNFDIAQEYNGKCNLRFDDTNPEKGNIEYIESIKKDIKWLGFQWSGDVHYSSDYFSQFYNYAIELISKGLAYVDELSTQEIRNYRGTLTTPGKDSPYRNRTVKDNLNLFKKMKDGYFEEGKACLRAKIDMNSPLIIMRDPILYRIKFIKHYKTGNKWCIYPTYDFTHCISDAQEGITHSLCTLEFLDNRQLYNWVLKNISISECPSQYEFSRLNLEYTITSKRKLKLLVDNNYVKGWDDPRMPTISGLRRRGYTASSIRKFCRNIGITKKNSVIKMSLLESYIRDDLDSRAPRVMVVLDPVKLIIENYKEEESEVINILNHPKNPKMGSREVPFSREIWINRADFREKADKNYKRLVLNKEIRLRNAYNIRAEHIEKDSKGNVCIIYCTYDSSTTSKYLTNGTKKTRGIIHWVSALHALPISVNLYDYLFTVPNPDVIEDFLTTINNKSFLVKEGYAEPSLQKAEVGKAYQFEREGYFCLDENYTFLNKKLVFNRTVSLREKRLKISDN